MASILQESWRIQFHRCKVMDENTVITIEVTIKCLEKKVTVANDVKGEHYLVCSRKSKALVKSMVSLCNCSLCVVVLVKMNKKLNLFIEKQLKKKSAW